MWSRNAFTERLRLEWPILQAPMGSYSTPALAAAVSNAGGLGGIGMWGFSSEDAERRIAGFRQQSGGSLNVNYPLWDDPGDLRGKGAAMRERLQSLYDSKSLGRVPEPKGAGSAVDAHHLAMLERTRPEVVSFHFALPEPATLRAITAAGIYTIASATTVAEARMLEASGIDAVIAQGTEAGGHRATFTGVDIGMQPGLFALLPQVVDAVKVPVIAAGGIADGRTIAAAFMLGASAVQLGTAFLRCDEAGTPESHRVALAEADDAATIVSSVVSGRPARFIRNRLIDVLSPAEPLPFPAQLSLTAPLFSSGDRAVGALFSGQSAALTRAVPAGDLMRILAAETGERLKAFGGST
jgi:nitronate monooxygenase